MGGAADERTVHEGAPAVDEKWICQVFARERRAPPPLGLPDAFGAYAAGRGE